MKRLHKFYFALIITLSIFSVSFAQNRISNQQEMSAAHYIRTNLATLFPEWIYGDIDPVPFVFYNLKGNPTLNLYTIESKGEYAGYIATGAYDDLPVYVEATEAPLPQANSDICKKMLGDRIHINQDYLVLHQFLSPGDHFYYVKFSTPKGDYFMDLQSLQIVDRQYLSELEAEIDEYREQNRQILNKKWDEILTVRLGKTTTGASKVLEVNAFKWYRGCFPTSAAMVLHYHGKGDVFSRIPHTIDSPFWWEGPGNVYFHVTTNKTLVDNIVYYLNTNPDENLSWGYAIPESGGVDANYGVLRDDEPKVIRGVTSSDIFDYSYDYEFFSHQKETFSTYQLMTQIDRNCPFVFGITDHSQCAFGYQNDGNDIYYYNTWDTSQHVEPITTWASRNMITAEPVVRVPQDITSITEAMQKAPYEVRVDAGMYTITENIDFPSKKLKLKGGITVNLDGKYIRTNIEINPYSPATFIPDICVRNNGDPNWFIKGQYSDIQTALNNASSGQTIYVNSGEITLTCNVTVPSGITLTIIPDTKVGVDAGYALTVHGKIEADGATFKSSGSGRWYGIDVDGSSSSYIKNCQIKDCDYGIIVGGSCAMSIKKNDIQAHYTGIRITEDSNPWIEDCYIQAKTIAPIITTGNGDGVVMRCNIGSTTLYNGPYYGHENMGSGSTCFNYYFCGRNKFEGNITYVGIYILGGYPTYAYGYNWIERPAYTTPYHVYNASGHSIGAQNNYWGGTDPLVGGYTVYYQPVLGSPPDPVGPSWSLSKEVTDVLNHAWQAYRENDYARAKELAKSCFQTNKSKDESSEALFLAMKSAYREGTLADEEENLLSIMKDKSNHYTANYEAVRWLMKLNLYRGETRKALDLALSVPDTSLFGREILLDLGIDLLEKRKDMDKAVKVFNIMTDKYPDEETKTVKENILAFYQNRLAKTPKTQPQSKMTVAESGNLLQVYPNPFNLNTTITYHLAEPVFVKVIIYDLLGRKVNTLISGRMEAGSHDIIWDGKDEWDRIVPSGIYVCRIVAGSQRGTIKLLLAK
ncbi:MAG TPA: hypothetical protein DHW42_07845 [Candidatus Marinimicrobia bacterium]|nr:hypothetical protein [Candidatus Neomarinimicrobiota bacterium]